MQEKPIPDVPVSINVYLDDAKEPIATYRPPATFQLDTLQIEDGEHTLRIRAVDALGTVGTRKIPFFVNNGPGITVTGLRAGTTVSGTLNVNINAFSGNEPFDPVRAESQGPIPVWTWVMSAIILAWAAWYGIEFLRTPTAFANTPTYATNPSTTSESLTSYTAAVAPNQPASGKNAVSAPKYSGKGVAAGFDYEATGASAYTTNCASCHGASGAGVPGAFPAIVNDPVVIATDPRNQIHVVLKGLQGKRINGKSYSGVMPAFAQLSDADIAAIIDHERTSWGNHSQTVTPDQVTGER
ncbi:MAG: cytochrome c [Candidatus Eremiobacteraeota bacterium]|nr:cytochrome c [Candidatus Eremiobacteraeota bacterium]